jgi:hypothetical protein
MNEPTSRIAFKILILMTIIFTILKLIGVIAWGWIYVLSPMIIPIGSIAIMSMAYSIVVLAQIIDKKK